jgi:putative phosphoribosyl transferase
LDLTRKAVILVDDGLATGSTMSAAAEAVGRLGPARVIVAVPVGSEETCDRFRDVVDEIVCELTPKPFHAVGLWYDDFTQTSDEEVRDLLARAKEHVGSSA